MANLWEIDALILTTCIDTETGEIIDENLLNELQLERDTKIENIAKWIKNLEADSKAYKEQKDIFAQKQKSAESKMDSLKRYLSAYLDGNQFEAKDKSIKCTFRKSESVNILSLDELRDEYKVEKIEVSADKKAIKEAIKNGLVVAGAELITSNNLQIK